MANFNWKTISPSINVLYSSLEDPHSCDEFTDDVAALRLPSGYGIDIAWKDGEQVFVVRLFNGTYHENIVETKAASAREVIDLVTEWVHQYSSETSYFPANPSPPQTVEGTVSKYMHTIDGKPAYFDGEQLLFCGKGTPLSVLFVDSLKEIRANQQSSEIYRKHVLHDYSGYHGYGYIRFKDDLSL